MEYTCTKFSADSSIRFHFRARTHTQSQIPLITLSTRGLRLRE